MVARVERPKRFCSACGQAVAEDARFCPACGVAVGAAGPGPVCIQCKAPASPDLMRPDGMVDCPWCGGPRAVSMAAGASVAAGRAVPAPVYVAEPKRGGGFVKKLAGGIIVGIVGLSVLGALAGDEDGGVATSATPRAAVASASRTPAPTSSAATVTISDVGSRSSDSGSYVYTEGEITNTSNRSLEFLRLVVSWYDSRGGFITSEVGYAEFNPVLSGQTSPFTVMTRYNPEMATYRITATSSRDEISVSSVTFRPQ